MEPPILFPSPIIAWECCRRDSTISTSFWMKVSPPDQGGFVNFGDIQIMSKLQARHAELVIAEIDTSLVRIGGDNSMHISEIDWFVEALTCGAGVSS